MISLVSDSDSEGGDEDEMRNLSVTLEKKDSRKDSSALRKDTKMQARGESELYAETENLRKLLAMESKKSEDNLRRLQYLQAEFDNYRKRIDREVKEIEEFSTSKLAKKLLPVLDELELAINSAEIDGEKKSIVEGVKMVSKNLRAALEAEGLRRIEAVGKPFNPQLHEALERVLGKNNTEDIVVEEIRTGYIFKDKILRPSLVKVEVAPRNGDPVLNGGKPV